jgi:hypothetical protein
MKNLLGLILFLLLGFFQLASSQTAPTFKINNPGVLSGAAGSFVEIEIHLDNIANLGVTGVNFRLTYDPNVMFISRNFLDIEGSIMEDGIPSANDLNRGELLVVITNPESAPITKNGLLVKLGAYLLAAGNPNVALLPRAEPQNPPLSPAPAQAAVFPSSPYSASVTGEPAISITIGSVTGSPNSTVDIPLTINELDDRGVRGFLFEVRFDPSLIEFSSSQATTIRRDGAIIGPSGTTGVTINVDNTNGVLRITGASTSYYTSNQTGRFFAIRGTLKNTGGTGAISLPYTAGLSYLNSGLPYGSNVGSVTVQQSPGILTLSQTSTSLPPEGGSAQINVTNTGEGPLNWSVSSGQAWISISPASGSGNGSFSITGAANTTFQPRTATVTVSAPGASGSPATVTVTQAANNLPQPSIESINPNSAQAGSTLNVSIAGTGFIQGLTTFSFGSGISVNSTSVNSTTAATVNITIAGSATAGARTITVTNPAPGGGSATLANGFTVTQPIVPVLSVTPTSISASSDGGITAVNIANTGTGTLSWTATSSQSWVTLSQSSGTAPSVLNATVAANASATSRTATITITASGATGSPATVTVTQSGVAVTNPVPTITGINPNSASLGSNLNVTISGSGFVAGLTSVNFGEGVTTNSAVVNSPNSLTANITVSGSTGAGTRNVTVTNPAPGGGSATLASGLTLIADVQMSIDPTTVSLTNNASTVAYTISFSGGSGSWNIESSQSWVLLSTNSGSGNGSVVATIESNTGTQSRIATITLTSSQATNSPVQAFITQSGITIPPPTAVADSYDGLANTRLVVNQPGVLSNDILPSGVTQVIAQLEGNAVTEFGTLNLASNGGFTFDPALNKAGIVTYQYRAINPQNNGFTTSTITIRTFPAPPTTGGSTNPTGIEIASGGLLEWDPVNGASSYSIEYQNQPFGAGATVVNNIISNRVTGLTQPRFNIPSNLPKDVVFYFRVNATVGTLTSAFSNPRTFVVIDRPPAPTLVLPVNNAKAVPSRPTFTWRSSKSASSYTLEILDTSNFGAPVTRYTSIKDTIFTVPVDLTGGPTYYWRTLAVNGAGQSDSSPIFYFSRGTATSVDLEEDIPTTFAILPNYPNPFNPTTNLRFSLPVASTVKIEVFDLSGRVVMTIAPRSYTAGTHSAILDASSLGSGLYVYTIRAGDFIGTGKLTLLK